MSAALTQSALKPNHAKFLAAWLKEIKSIKAERIERAEAWANNHTGYRQRWENYCIHGTFIGDPYGADYLCGACEAGETDYVYTHGIVYWRWTRARERYETALSLVATYSERIAQAGRSGLLDWSLADQLLGDVETCTRSMREIAEEWL